MLCKIILGLHLYWNDLREGVIYRLPINISDSSIVGQVSEVYRNSTLMIFALTADNNTVYFTAWNEKLVN